MLADTGVWQRLFRPRPTAPLIDNETGLAGIEYLLQRLSEEIARSRRHGRDLLVVVLVLNHFESLTATERRALLPTASTELRRATRRNDVVSYLGDGRFALMLTEPRPEFIVSTTTRIAAGLAAACNAGLGSETLDTDYGVSLYETNVPDALALVVEAELDLQRRRDARQLNSSDHLGPHDPNHRQDVEG